MSSSQIIKINQLFIQPSSETTRTPPIGYHYLNDLGRMLVDLISYVLGYRGVEDVDDTIMAMLSIFSPGKLPAAALLLAIPPLFLFALQSWEVAIPVPPVFVCLWWMSFECPWQLADVLLKMRQLLQVSFDMRRKPVHKFPSQPLFEYS